MTDSILFRRGEAEMMMIRTPVQGSHMVPAASTRWRLSRASTNRRKNYEDKDFSSFTYIDGSVGGTT